MKSSKPKPVLARSVLRTLDRTAQGRTCDPEDTATARSEMMRVMRNFSASTWIESASGDYVYTAETWWKLLGGLA